MKRIYLDHSATTTPLPEVWEAMRACATAPGNAASSHGAGRTARRALETARETVARLLEAEPDEVIFTSGATEANNLAIFGLAGEAPGTIAAGCLEHSCVVEPIQRLCRLGFQHHPLPVGSDGAVQLSGELPSSARLACLMLANHETGVLQPVADLVARAAGTPVHCDAAAAAGKIPISFRKLGVATLTLSGHKFHGPPGIGVLLVRRDRRLQPQLFGGHQQRGLRPGTEPVALAVGLATALSYSMERWRQNQSRVQELRSCFLDILKTSAAPIVIQGMTEQPIPHVLNVAFPGCQADVLLMRLDLAGIACSTGSACSSGSLLPSPVLKAMGVAPEVLRSAMRFSFSAFDTIENVEEAALRTARAVMEVRRHGER